MTMNTDLIVIGAGPGGYRAAEHAAKKGLEVVIIESGEVGGTCLNRGCIPTKTYVHSATFEEAIERQPIVVGQLRSGVESILGAKGITLVRSLAEFADAHTVSLSDGDTFTAPNIIVATGSSAKMLPLPDISDKRLMTSTELLQLTTLPKRLAIIGAGVIGMEFASIFHRFGSEVVVTEYLKECLPMLDSDVAKRLRKLMEKSGIAFHMNTAVQSLGDIDADVILMATGRKPNVQPDFSSAGFDFDERMGIHVDDNFQTSVPGIYAIGDVNGRQMLAHAAEAQAKAVIEHITATDDKAPADSSWTSIIPAAIFTTPEAACVGKSEDQLKREGTPYECRKAFHRANGKAVTMNQTDGMLKLLSEPGAGRIIGCHAFGAHSADLIQEAAALMAMGATVEQLRHIVHIHPTLSEILLAAAEA
ncbi:MAG: NAD(P)/FAD-dependent oxidoreductase [Prevotella sp.]|nr:NAD(P)/FAD-dependent oxidoreductase [Prevotella sp.]